MREKDFDFVLKEHFDLSDRKSMKTLLSLNEADQNQAMVALASKLYEKIVAKVDDIDFGTIPASKGDITKIGNYLEMKDCLNTIDEILVHYKQDTSLVNTVDKAIENIKSSKATWEKAFAIDCEFPITFYNTIVLSIVSSVSLLISSSIDFIKEPGRESFQISFDKAGYSKTKDKLLFQNLEKFNKSYAKGDIEKLMSSIVKANSSLKESCFDDEPVNESVALTVLAGVVGAGALVAVLITIVIPILHELVSALYSARQDVADYFEIQAKIVQFNAEQLKYDYTKSEKEIKKIYSKQVKIAEVFRKISSTFAVKMSKAESDARKLVEKEKMEKYKAEDLGNDQTTITTSSIF